MFHKPEEYPIAFVEYKLHPSSSLTPKPTITVEKQFPEGQIRRVFELEKGFIPIITSPGGFPIGASPSQSGTSFKELPLFPRGNTNILVCYFVMFLSQCYFEQ